MKNDSSLQEVILDYLQRVPEITEEVILFELPPLCP